MSFAFTNFYAILFAIEEPSLEVFMTNNNPHNHSHKNNNQQQKEPPIKKFVLGTKELDDKTAEFEYDKGLYTITDIVGETRTEVYKSRNMQESYTKWNVYIGRKKERPSRKTEEEKAEPVINNTQATSTPSVKDASTRNSDHHPSNGGNSHKKRNHRNRGNHKPQQS